MAKPIDLVSLGYGRGELRHDPAQSVFRIDKALGHPLDINSAYRDWDTQYRLWVAYQRDPKHNPLALHPDLSWHCKGMAFDTDQRPTAILEKYGWRFIVGTEPWHGQYYADKDQFYGQPAGGGSTPFPTSKEDTVTYPVRVNGKNLMHLGPGFIKHFATNSVVGASKMGVADLTKNIVAPDDKWIDLDTNDFLNQLDSFGVPRDVVDVNTGHVSPAIGKPKVSGGMWSWAREAAKK